LISPLKITLDFYDNNIIRINAKQFDRKRTVNITCTDNGKHITLDKDTMTVYIGYKKSDGKCGFYDAKILDDGTIYWELKEQMLVSVGVQKVDVCIVATSGLSVDMLKDITSITDLGVAVISTMPLYINVVSTAIDHDSVESSSEFDALNNALTRLATTESHLKDVENTLNENEDVRKSQESDRVKAEEKRESDFKKTVDDCNSRIDETISDCNTNINNTIADCNSKINETISNCNTNVNEAIEKCNEATNNSISATRNTIASTEKCNEATNDAKNTASTLNTLKNNCETVTKNANEAATKANEAAELCKSVVDQTGVVLQTEKGVANGVATLDENTKIPESQLPFTIVNDATVEVAGTVLDGRVGKGFSDSMDQLNRKLKALQEQIDTMPVIHHGTEEPTSSIGKDGDIYFRIISE
jgi:uncharacterized protein YukE